jgi:NADPH:quinone reductase-like Zn-dependent oxidoreductase
MDSMRALRAHQRGGPETLVFESAPVPTPGAGEVLVAVSAAAITFAELGWDATWTRDGHDRTPIIPSHEFSGRVVAAGPDVLDPAVGDPVCGLVPFDRDGAAAEFVSAPVGSLAVLPEGVSPAAAAALPLAALTAWQALVDHAHLRAGEDVLVHGGAGGVGSFAVQLAVSLDARTTATCLGKDVPYVEALGATTVIDVERAAFDSEKSRFDVVLDTLGGSTLERSFAVLRRGGRLVTLQAPPSAELAAAHEVDASFFLVRPDRDELSRLLDLVATGELRVPIAATFPLAQGRAAFLLGNEIDRPPGKVVLEVRPDA